jgi:hypothetical protein
MAAAYSPAVRLLSIRGSDISEPAPTIGPTHHLDTEGTVTRQSAKQSAADPFERVRAVGLALPDVDAAVRYDGSPVLKMGGCFMAGVATHRSAEPDTLVVRMDFEERDCLIADAPDTYYITDYYRNNPVVLVRLSRVDRDALHDLLSVSWRLTSVKAGRRGRRRRGGGS